MCESRMGVPGGKPLRLTTNVTFAAVMLPDASRVTSNVIVELPVPPASVPVIGGFSFEVCISAENVGLGVDGVDGEQVQAAARTAKALAKRAKRFIIDGSFVMM